LALRETINRERTTFFSPKKEDLSPLAVLSINSAFGMVRVPRAVGGNSSGGKKKKNWKGDI